MSNFDPNNLPPQPTQPPMRPRQFQPPTKAKRNKRPWIIGLGVVGLLTLGFGMGQSAAGEPQTVTETETVTETVEKTSPACIEALDASDELLEYMGEALGISADAMGYAASFDWDALDAETAKLEELNPLVADARDDYDTAAVTCRLGDS